MRLLYIQFAKNLKAKLCKKQGNYILRYTNKNYKICESELKKQEKY